MASSNRATSHSDIMADIMLRNIQRTPSPDNGLLKGPKGSIALVVHAHEMASSSTATTTTQRYDITLLLIGSQVFYVDDVEFERPHGQSCGIDAHAPVAVGKQFLDKLVLPFFKTFYTERHAS